MLHTNKIELKSCEQVNQVTQTISDWLRVRVKCLNFNKIEQCSARTCLVPTCAVTCDRIYKKTFYFPRRIVIISGRWLVGELVSSSSLLLLLRSPRGAKGIARHHLHRQHSRTSTSASQPSLVCLAPALIRSKHGRAWRPSRKRSLCRDAASNKREANGNRPQLESGGLTKTT